MPKKMNNRRKFRRFHVRSGVFILKNSNMIRIGPMIDIGAGGCAFDLMHYDQSTEIGTLNECTLNIRIGDYLMENFSYNVARIQKNLKGRSEHSDLPKHHLGIQFNDFRHEKAFGYLMNNSCLEDIEDRRCMGERRTGLNRRKSDFPQYRSGERAGRDRRGLSDRRKWPLIETNLYQL